MSENVQFVCNRRRIACWCPVATFVCATIVHHAFKGCAPSVEQTPVRYSECTTADHTLLKGTPWLLKGVMKSSDLLTSEPVMLGDKLKLQN